ncbi:MAG: hypothetical protein SF053_12510 [Bacteroidia bacterium]|nr:hypothetical protein [Bacteroidia bacterium]
MEASLPLALNQNEEIFQTALYIAISVKQKKQSYIASLCGIAPSYLSKLKGWYIPVGTEVLIARPPTKQARFGRLARTLIDHLAAQDQILFEDGWFVEMSSGRKWGQLPYLSPEIAQSLPPASKPPKAGRKTTSSYKPYWQDLEIIGDWDLDAEARTLTGGGLYSFLLSQETFDGSSCLLEARICFLRFDEGDKDLPASFGLVLGWQEFSASRTYYHLLCSEERMLLEQVGARGMDDFSDYTHVDDGVAFSLATGACHHFLIRVLEDTLLIFVDDQLVYNVAKPPGLSGRMGIRPWRSRVRCHYLGARRW